MDLFHYMNQEVIIALFLSITKWTADLFQSKKFEFSSLKIALYKSQCNTLKHYQGNTVIPCKIAACNRRKIKCNHSYLVANSRPVSNKWLDKLWVTFLGISLWCCGWGSTQCAGRHHNTLHPSVHSRIFNFVSLHILSHSTHKKKTQTQTNMNNLMQLIQ